VGAWPQAVERVAAVLRARAVDARIEEFPEGTPTAARAAEAAGCDVGEIVKTLVFVCDGLPVLALVPGDRRADPAKVALAAHARGARIARPEEVRGVTGFEPGGVAPFPVPQASRTLLDGDLLAHEIVWVGAGSPSHMAGLSPVDLARLTGAEVADLAED
jgi:prolyl-tRNA editing enzyme YbaK/EbsC (Cys-tRNA(Pro) deacylase)